MIVLIAKALVRPDKVDVYEKAFKELQAKVKANEPGVSVYELCKDPQIPNGYQMIEIYEDEAVQDHHVTTDYYKTASRNIVAYLQGDHMDEINRRGLMDPMEFYPLIKTMSYEIMRPI